MIAGTGPLGRKDRAFTHFEIYGYVCNIDTDELSRVVQERALGNEKVLFFVKRLMMD